MRMDRGGLKEYRKMVLVIEDEICCAESLQLLLKFYGCKVLLAHSCEEGLALLRKKQKRIDLILLDISMPGKTGFDFLNEAKSEGMLRSIPVIIQSGESHEIIQQALDMGACGKIHKPYLKEEISKLLKKIDSYDMPIHLNNLIDFAELDISNIKINKEFYMHDP